MRYGSVCSGIEAATVAWHPLGWEAAWYSEIEPFPCAVLKHHYPAVPNYGDMTKYEEWPDEPINLLVGGTPCQSFSVAGLRKGLADPRGNLMLTYGAIARRYRPEWLVWENVSGVLSSNGGRDFGTFLGMLGELGYGFAYRVLDAQYFGVAQRRRRCFLIANARSWQRAAAVLFESHSLQGHPAPSREAREEAARGTEPSIASGKSNIGTLMANAGTKLWLGNQEALSGDYHILQPIAVQGTLIGRSENAGPNGLGLDESGSMFTLTKTDIHAVAQPITQFGDVAGSLTARHDSSPCADRGQNVVAQPINIYGGNKRADRPEGGFYVRTDEPTSKTLDAASGLNPTCSQGGTAVMQPVAWDEELNARENLAGAMLRGGDGGRHDGVMTSAMQVRRLTPIECERLQGFPDGYTNIPWRKKPESPDGPRYKALGNSMAVPVMAWIGKRIKQVSEL